MILHRLAAVIFFLAASIFSRAQQIHFVYLQTENSQPFYVKLENKVSSSSASGYLILPKLLEGDYKITVGFPRKEFPEENFQLSVDNKNLGFLLKNFGDKGWGLFNMQSFSIVMGGNSNSPVDTTKKDLQDDAFSKMLANVVKDSSLLEKNTVIMPSSGKAANKDTLAISTMSKEPDSSLQKAVTDTAAATESFSPSIISRTLNKKNKDGIEMVYVDKTGDNTDTIRIFIPGIDSKNSNDSMVAVTGANDSGNKINPVMDSAVKVIAPPVLSNSDTATSIAENSNQKKVELPERDTSSTLVSNAQDSTVSDRSSVVNDIKKDNENVEIDKVKKDSAVEADVPKVIHSSIMNSDCKSFASTDDFIKLRKKMAGEKSDESMISAAKKIFRSKCFSTEQIKNLSFLFLSDEGKYKFFDAAYAFTADSNQYQILQSQLSDPYYVNRFKAMIHK
ncbi:MAG: DUF4476 domain-containing protein [Bacteroidota bacterium]|nr:DUF4476 domain-containing protein [Bacteroidota bacterium]